MASPRKAWPPAASSSRSTPLPADYGGAAGGLGPDGQLIWTNSYSTFGGEGFAFTPVRLWSPRTRKVTTLEPAGQHGGALSPPVFFDPGHELAAWEQADGSQQEIVEFNLATGATDVVARGYVGPPVFVGDAFGSGYLGWTTASASSYLASTASLASASLATATTWADSYAASADYVIVESSPASKALHLRRHWHLVSGSTVSALRCAGPAKPAGR